MLQRIKKLAVLMSVASVIVSCQSSGNSAELGIAGNTATTGSYQDLTEYHLASISNLQFNSGSTNLQLGSDGSTYLMVVSSANTTPSSYTLQLTAQSLPALSTLEASFEEEGESSEAELFHEYLQEVGGVLSESEQLASSGAASKSLMAVKATKSVGETKKFSVLSSMSSITKCADVTGELKAITDNVYFYVDTEALGEIDDSTIQELTDNFQEISLPRANNYFGTESDIDSDDHISFLITPVVNGMATSGGLVTGFYFPGDQYTPSGSNPCSNKMEVMYLLSPDKGGTWGPPISKSFATGNILPGVMAHEYQHMISFNQHVLLGNGSTEKPWLNEAMSHLMEDLAGYPHENHSRVKLFLDKPNTTSIIPSTSPRLAERGAGYLFLRYLFEQHSNGTAMTQCLDEGSKTGISNILNCFENEGTDFDDFDELLNNFSLAVVLDGTGLSTNSRYNFEARQIDSDTGNLTGICLRCDTQDGRGTVLKGPTISEVDQFPITSSLYAGASQYYLFNSGPGAISLNAGGSAELAGTVVTLK